MKCGFKTFTEGLCVSCYMYCIFRQEIVIEYLRDNWLHLSGDGHCDSSGYSTKYAAFLLMDSAADLQFSTCK